MSLYFGDISPAPPDPVFNITTRYNNDKNSYKVNLGVGAYRDENGQPWVLPVVREIEEMMSQDHSLNHEYLPIEGLQSFRESATRLMLGNECRAIVEDRVRSIQCLSGTGSIRLGAAFLKRFHPDSAIYVAKPTWGNHRNIFKNEFFPESMIKEYPYFDSATRGLNLEGMINALKEAPERSIIVLHACAHNPTGVDPNREQWEAIADVIKERNLMPLFDSAYQGFASGDLNEDAWSVRYFVSLGMEMLIAQSFAKNFGLYNERAGNLIVVAKNSSDAAAVLSHLKALARPMWSNPPNHGARIVATALNNEDLRAHWFRNLQKMANRIRAMRELLLEKLRALGTPGTWTHIVNQIGMFSFTGLTVRQCEVMTSNHSIYLLPNGRINICGLNHDNIDHVAKAIDDVVRNIED
ncbi:uncharacterized protein TRIADDRAFT_51058 [Trichoplax adhaerens]|uniref:Aspartate aminotransferase n=1 Tax=Trichoplax adhaerens TaxID=10228 RepID=B3SB31_TRIAD|nr:hypothetical protein TRIADDRAFT_51058 [Trichoplax adhaerens]EDV20091.1 hypothetical protein TRIADDRAFT_51058 [Trichoplax adhaerens]|eukprot:XP_002117475.1 hypothetical protein TRIADDRAFT_51058 [Trichoplax adhaerens]